MPRPKRRSKGDDGAPHPIDVHIGAQVRTQRLLLGMTQTDLAQELGLTYQQMHKYENGLNRISAARLFLIAEKLNVPILGFFEGLEFSSEPFRENRMEHREILELVRLYRAMPEEFRRQFLHIAKLLTEQLDQD